MVGVCGHQGVGTGVAMRGTGSLPALAVHQHGEDLVRRYRRSRIGERRSHCGRCDSLIPLLDIVVVTRALSNTARVESSRAARHAIAAAWDSRHYSETARPHRRRR